MSTSTDQTKLVGTSAVLSYGPNAAGDGPSEEISFNVCYSSKINGVQVYDDADRSLKYTEYTIRTKALVSAKSLLTGALDINETMTFIRESLRTPGGKLVFTGKGFGTFIVDNDANGVVADGANYMDVKNGPKPKLLSFTPIGDQNAAYIEWEVSTCLFDSEDSLGDILAFTYDVEWNIDKHGYTVIVYTGSLEIPIPLRSNTTFTADTYRINCVPPCDNRFQREQKFKLSKDRRTLHFSVTDTQMPAPLPVGATMCNIKHLVRGSGPTSDAFVRWENRISGTVRVDPRFPRKDTYTKFLLVAASRIDWAKKQAANNVSGIVTTNTPANIQAQIQANADQPAFDPGLISAGAVGNSTGPVRGSPPGNPFAGVNQTTRPGVTPPSIIEEQTQSAGGGLVGTILSLGLSAAASQGLLGLEVQAQAQAAANEVAAAPVGQSTQNARPLSQNRVNVFITDVEYEEDIFGVEDRFSITYVIMGCLIERILFVAGLWQAAGENSYSLWQSSNKDGPGHPRGNLQMKYNKRADVILDLADPDAQLPPDVVSVDG